MLIHTAHGLVHSDLRVIARNGAHHLPVGTCMVPQVRPGPKQGFSGFSLPIHPSPNHVGTTFLQSSGGLRGLYPPHSALAGFSSSTKVKGAAPPPPPPPQRPTQGEHLPFPHSHLFPQCGKDLRVPNIPQKGTWFLASRTFEKKALQLVGLPRPQHSRHHLPFLA